jgi:hypothetical protein
MPNPPNRVLLVDDGSVSLRSDLAEAIGIGPYIDVPPAPPAIPTYLPAKYAGTPRNAPCPCGSGKKYKRCHYLSGGPI